MDFSFLYKGLLDASFGTMVLYTLVMTHITIVSVTLYLHRYSAHRALELNGAAEALFPLLAVADHGHADEGMDRRTPQTPRRIAKPKRIRIARRSSG